ncbi:MAG: hypothetical protein AAGC55_25650, partial [Myxococcota bacterium]
AGSPAEAQNTASAKGKRTYVFLVHDIALKDGIPAEITEVVRGQLLRAIRAHARLSAQLPEGAPDPKSEPKKFSAFIARNKLEPYRLNVEVTQYTHGVEPSPNGGKRLTVSLALRTFGETMPVRKMAFSGEGSATIRMDVGKKLRERDSTYARKEAAKEAIAEALTISLQRLDRRASGKKNKRGAKKKRKK